MSDGTPGNGGIARALSRVAAAALNIVHTRLELAAVEFAEERERTRTRIILIGIAVLFLAFGVLAASALIVVLFWDTHRIAAVAAVTVAHFAIGGYALLRLQSDSRNAPAPFAATLAELERDHEWLVGEMLDRPRK